MKTKTIFITGVSSGIGLATAQYFLDKNWNAVLVTRKISPSLQKLASERCLIIQADIKNKKEIEKSCNLAIKTFGPIDVVVNNVGYGLLGPAETTTTEQITDQLQVNILSTILVTQAFIPHFREKSSGIFVNISSMMGKIPFPFFSFYNATKFAIEGFSESLAYELEPFNIAVKIIEPGTIRTNFFTSSLQETNSKQTLYESFYKKVITSVKKRGQQGESPEVVAETIYNAINDNKQFGRYTPDPTAKLLIFLRKITPTAMFRKILLKTM